jgi:psiF repeat-containing protein
MKRLLIAIGLTLSVAAPLAALTPQQQKMKDCNAEASQKSLKGDARKQFMSECLGAGGAKDTGTLTAQQQKMKDCNAEASKQHLNGSARAQFMSSCLSGK